jgi:hypothetical protein
LYAAGLFGRAVTLARFAKMARRDFSINNKYLRVWP